MGSLPNISGTWEAIRTFQLILLSRLSDLLKDTIGTTFYTFMIRIDMIRMARTTHSCVKIQISKKRNILEIVCT